MTDKLESGDVMTLDHIRFAVDLIKNIKPRVVPINGYYWWAKDRTGEWVPVVEETHYKPPGAIDHEK